MRVAIVHDDLVQWGGAERILEGIAEIYPDAPIFTSLIDWDNKEIKKRFEKKIIITSFLQKIPGWKNIYKILLPFYPIAFEQFRFDGFDLVISHTTRFAKAIITKPRVKHISYIHTPPRFLWHLSEGKNYGLEELLMSKLRIYDFVSASRPDFIIAGSKNAQNRIKKIYRRESKLVYPFLDLKRFEGVETFDGEYFAVVARESSYKRIGLAKKACERLGAELKIISGGMEDEMVVQVLSGCKALVIPGIEDFGIASLEAQALGKPVVAFKEGGALETAIDGKTGLFFDEPTVESLAEALGKNLAKINKQNCKENAQKFSKEIFVKNFRQTVDSLVYT